MDEETLSSIANKSRNVVEWWARTHSRVVPIKDNVVLARVLGGYLMYVDMVDKSLAPHLAGEGFWEMWITQALARYVRRGMRCIDVGANFGYYTMLLGDIVGSQGFVWAFEPNPYILPLLRESVFVNGFGDRVCVVPRAAGNYAASDELFLPADGRWGSASLYDLPMVTERIAIETQRLDAIPLENPIDFIKIDAEGMEPEVWEGMAGIIKCSPKLVVALEWSPRAYKDPAEFIRHIEADGFRIDKIDGDGQIVSVDKGKLVERNADWEMLWISHV